MKGYSLHIGVNSLDPDDYGIFYEELNNCELDAKDMESICFSLGYKTKLFLGNLATKQNIENSITDLASIMKSGDILCVTFSGHGRQYPDFNNDELDGYDEAWCLYDKPLLDDDLKLLWTLFKKGIRILVVSDSCHSASILSKRSYDNKNRNPFDTLPAEVVKKNISFNSTSRNIIRREITQREINASLKSISATSDNLQAYEKETNGVLTKHLKIVWNSGNFNGNYKSFFEKIKQSLKDDGELQPPQLRTLGKPNSNFDRQKPFTI